MILLFVSLFLHNLRKMKMSFVVNLCCACSHKNIVVFFFPLFFFFLILFLIIILADFNVCSYVSDGNISFRFVYAWAFCRSIRFILLYPCISAGLFASFHSISVPHLSTISLTRITSLPMCVCVFFWVLFSFEQLYY